MRLLEIESLSLLTPEVLVACQWSAVTLWREQLAERLPVDVFYDLIFKIKPAAFRTAAEANVKSFVHLNIQRV